MLHKRIAGTAASADGGCGRGILRQIGALAASVIGTDVRHGRLSAGQLIARNTARSVTDKVVGRAAAAVGRQVGGSIGRSLVRGALGGLLRRG